MLLKFIRRVCLFAAATITAVAQTYTPGTTYFGRGSYIEYIAGDLPFIISAPHGGSANPAELPDRTSGTFSTDTNTDLLARAVGQAMFSRFGQHHPHVIICRLDRLKIDCNREIVEGGQGNPLTEISWNDFQNFILVAKQTVLKQFGRGFYIDLHGHGHAVQRLEIGYLLSAGQLGLSDMTLNSSATYANQSSIRELNVRSPSLFAALLRGPTSLGGRLAIAGYPCVPSPPVADPGGDPYFNGGYNTAQHGSESGGTISAVQIEANYTGVRDTEANRGQFANSLAEALGHFFTDHLALNLADALPTVTAISNRTVPVNGSTSTISFTVGDAVTPASALVLSGASSNPALVPVSGIVFGGSGASRTVKVFPAANQIGSAVVTVTVTDGNGGMAPEIFSVTVTATPSQTWRLAYFGIAAATGSAADLADPDLDGLKNLLEFALLSDPTAAASPPLPVAARSGGNLTLTYSRNNAAVADGVLFAVETVAALGDGWTTVGVSEAILSDDGTVQQVRATVAGGGAAARFARLKVTRP